MSVAGVEVLNLTEASGVWAVRTSSVTVYYVDADARALLRQTGPGSSLGIADGTWVPLVSVESVRGEGVGVIRVGDRHKYVYDYDPSATDYAWWIQ